MRIPRKSSKLEKNMWSDPSRSLEILKNPKRSFKILRDPARILRESSGIGSKLCQVWNLQDPSEHQWILEDVHSMPHIVRTRSAAEESWKDLDVEALFEFHCRCGRRSSTSRAPSGASTSTRAIEERSRWLLTSTGPSILTWATPPPSRPGNPLWRHAGIRIRPRQSDFEK